MKADREKQIEELEKEIAKLKCHVNVLKGGTNCYDDLRDYFCKKVGCPDYNHILIRQRQNAWNHLRKLAICSVCNDDKLIKELTVEEWDKSRDFLKLLIDFYVENAPNP